MINYPTRLVTPPASPHNLTSVMSNQFSQVASEMSHQFNQVASGMSHGFTHVRHQVRQFTDILGVACYILMCITYK